MSQSNSLKQNADRLAKFKALLGAMATENLSASSPGDPGFKQSFDPFHSAYRNQSAVGSHELLNLAALPCPAFADTAGLSGGGTDADASAGFGWSRHPLPPGRSVHLASSRLGQQLESFPRWFDAVRTFGCLAAAGTSREESPFLLTADGTTADRFACRIGELFSIPVVRVKRFPKRITTAWIAQQREPTSDWATNLWVDPVTDVKMDTLLISIAAEVRVLRVRDQGNIDLALKDRLRARQSKTWLLLDDSLTKSATTQRMMESGATGWWLYDSPNDQQDGSDRTKSATCAASVISVAEVDSSAYAIHWTRRRQGAWPDQSDPAYLDDLIFRKDASDHHALAALRRILMTERMIASNDLIRSKMSVVCFADVGLSEIKQRRIYRNHLGRWDFEPYGIAIRKDCLNRLGARPVVYGDESTWAQMAEPDQPYFQLATSKDGNHDWRAEREIRVCGDVRLRQIGADDAVVFVPSEAEAKLIAPDSRWAVVVLG